MSSIRRLASRTALGAGPLASLLAPGCAPAEAPAPIEERPAEAAAQLVSDPIALDGPAIGLPDARHLHPDIAWNGTHFLVVWADNRATGGAQDMDVYAARVTPAGEVLDPTGILVSGAIRAQVHPEVASDGAGFFVVWEDYRASGGTDIYGARVDAQGTVLDPDGLALTTESGWEPSVTFDGSSYVAVWEDFGGGNTNHDLYGARVTPAGQVLDPGGFVVSGAAGFQSAPQIVSAGGGSFAAWLDERTGTPEIYGARIDQGAAVLDPQGIFLGANGLDGFDERLGPAVATNGAEHVVSWVSSTPAEDVLAIRVGLDGVVVPPGALNLYSIDVAGSRPALASNGAAFMAAWNDTFGIRTRRFADGNGIGGSLALPDLGDDPSYPAIEFGGGAYLVVSPSLSGFTARPIKGVLAYPNGVIGPASFPISMSLAAQVDAAGVFDGSSYLALWTDTRGFVSGGTGSDIHAARVSPVGVALDDLSFPVAASDGREVSARAASNGALSLVGWRWNNGLGAEVARVGSDGTLLDAAPIVLADNGTVADVASDGTSFVVVWSALQKSYATRVDAAGDVLDAAGIELPIAGEEVEFDGASYLITGGDPLRGVRLSPDGTVLDPAGFDLPYEQEASASSGENTLLVWRFGASGQIRAGRVGQDGTALDADPIVLGGGPKVEGVPSVGFDGVNYLVAWTETDTTLDASRVLGAYVSPSGQVLGASELVLSDLPTQASGAAVIGGADGQSLVLFSRFDPATHSVRLEGRLVSPDLGAACATAAECLTGICVDGVCCDSPCGGGSAGDCQACSVAAGAAEDGLCTSVADGAACDDGDACTVMDACSAGVCASPPVDCAAEACNAAACDPATGSCVSTPLPDGTPCEGGACQSGQCAGQGGAGGGGAGGAGSGGGGSGGAGASGGAGGGGVNEESGCGCRVPGESPRAGWLSGVLLLIPLLARRRRPRPRASGRTPGDRG